SAGSLLYYFFFFFQAEDGIRDFHVTGVQTCALPIFPPPGQHRELVYGADQKARQLPVDLLVDEHDRDPLGVVAGGELAPIVGARSEERRVGKECRSRWWRDE